jgi:uncharacterized membrane protein
MLTLILGLVLFLGAHSVRIVADDWRTHSIARLGERPWKGLYALVSIVGFGLIVWGYGMARAQPVVLWTPPIAMRHVAALLTLLAFVLVAAGNVPRNAIRARLGHPMLLGTKVWAFAHLLANGTLADVLLFGGFLVWAVVCFRSARRRDRAAGKGYPAGSVRNTAIAVIAGIVAWALFAFWLHAAWIGVAPFGVSA